ncbi:dTDP-4-dehydrorhamnose reductase [Tuwongella immobilis]|uniref:dTDP-4-dehydrorhamnose reductase n=1 Tax=Tuwongella immobilis TaxID=692036 RepID=A0A6C2YPC0_9BACT|nr:dTDP-4-dehydrorhamnose reductase [Tuwongella immobilis]VIP03029.1 dTDP-4-dehydrorhamnose reductase OS=Planctomyces maris DSM 8797 GN=PM8797T_14574 PE=4 SV=1: RmlD_sub_bind [Tuwongella immobilis]VTS03175.1 dTDP-4-dehydrorhamnose reductase OS=Planctomyces maris DSM 8797 GN=PM8797T_14574 PE=4 SV=1: RmlD_sub_bind [Tuwongella immobilis]
MRFAVLGSQGQLGRDLCPRLPGEVIPLTREQCDLANPNSIAPMLDEVAPSVFINCAAYNLVDKAEQDPTLAWAVNCWGVRALARECAKRSIRLVHYSTDYVFGLDAARQTPWHETDAPGPISMYGMSKLMGEYAVLAAHPAHLVIRTCGLYGVWGSGGKGGNFVETMIRVAGQGKPLRVVNDQVCCPTYTVDLAQATIALIEAKGSGLMHITNAEWCTWYQLAAAIFQRLNLTADLTPITSAEFDAPAKRPPYSVLSNNRLLTFGVPSLRSWSDALDAYLAERSQR